MKFVVIDEVVNNVVVGYFVVEEETKELEVVGIENYCDALAIAKRMTKAMTRKK